MIAGYNQAEVDKLFEKMEGIKKKAKMCRESSTLTSLEVSNKLLDTLGNNPSKQTLTTIISSQSQLDTHSLNADMKFESDRELHISPKSSASKIMIGQTRQDNLEDLIKIPENSLPIDDL